MNTWAWFSAACFYFLLGYLLQRTDGHYSASALSQLLVLWAAMLGLGWFSLRKFQSRSASEKGVPENWAANFGFLGLLFFTSYLALDHGVRHGNRPEWSEPLVMACRSGVPFALALAWVHNRRPRWIKPLAAVLGLSLILARVLTLKYSPTPFIDVFTTNSQGADFLLSAQNPYPQKYTDIYGGQYDYPPGYVYWPMVLLVQSISRALAGDIRYVHIAAEIVTAWSVWKIQGRFGHSLRLRALLPLLWLAFPPSLFILEMAWVDPLLIAFGALTVLAMLHQRWIWAGIALGAFAATKQYAVFFGILAVVYALRSTYQKAGWTPILRLITAASATFVIVMVPFAIADWPSFFRSTIQVPLNQGLRNDSLSIPAYLVNSYRWWPPGWLLTAVPLVSLAGASVALARMRPEWTFRAFCLGLNLVYGATFFFGKQAFCNYYFVLGFFTLLSLAAWLEPREPRPGMI